MPRDLPTSAIVDRVSDRVPASCCSRSTFATPTPSSDLVSGSGDHAKVVQHWRIRTEAEVTADELALTIDGLIGDDAERLTGATGLSTVPSVLHEIRLMLDQYWPSVPHVLIEPGVRTGIPLLVDNPKEVGADRIVNCLAAYQKFGPAAIVVDFGSSICVDVVSAKGEFLGGAIAPGVQVSSDAAAARSAALRRVELTRPRSVVGKNTVECMQAGAVFGFAGLVDGLVNRIREDVDGFGGDDVAVVATGHTAPLVLPDLHTVDALRPVPDPRRAAVGLRAQPRHPARQALRPRTAPNLRLGGSSRRSQPLRRSSGRSEERADQVDDAVVIVEHRDQLPLVEHRAGMRDAELDPSPTSARSPSSQPQIGVLVVELGHRAVGQAVAESAGPGRTTRRGGPSSAAPGRVRGRDVTCAHTPAPDATGRNGDVRWYRPSSWVR